MKNRGLLFLALSLLLWQSYELPSCAQESSVPSSLQRFADRQTSQTVSPQQPITAIVSTQTVISVIPQQPGFVEIHKKQGSPVPLLLGRPIMDRSGTIIVPAGTPVIGQLERVSKRSAKLTIQSLLVDDRMVSIQASSVQALPILALPRNSLQQSSVLASGTSVDAASEGVGALVRTFGSFEAGNQASDIVRGVTSLAQLAFMSSRSSKARLVQLPYGQPYLLQVQQTVAMPIATRQFPVATQQYPPQYGLTQYSGTQYSNYSPAPYPFEGQPYSEGGLPSPSIGQPYGGSMPPGPIYDPRFSDGPNALPQFLNFSGSYLSGPQQGGSASFYR